MYEYMMTEIEFLMDAMDSLSDGLISHKLIEPMNLQQMIDQVDESVKNRYPEYTVVMDQVQQYFDLPLVRFTCHKEQLVLQIPVYIQHYTENPLDLYYLHTVPVPLNINQQLLATKMEPHPYTQIHPKEPLLALSYSTYVPLTEKDLHNCYHFGKYYLCEHTFLSQRSSTHTCESAIYHNLPRNKSRNCVTLPTTHI